MKSAKQFEKFTVSTIMTISEVNADTIRQITIEAPLSGRISKVSYKFTWEDLSNTAALGALVTKGQTWGSVNEIDNIYREAMDAWTGNGKIAVVEGKSVPAYVHCDGQVNTDLPDGARVEVEKIRMIDELVEAGDNLNFYVFSTSLSNTLTTGTIRISATFDYEIASLSYVGARLPRTSAVGMQVAILANLDNDDNIAQYYVPSNGRVSNVRVTLMDTVGSFMGGEDSFYFGKKLYTDAQNSDDVIYRHTDDGIMIRGPNTLAVTDPEYALWLTSYSRKVWFMKKGEPLVINYQNTNTQRLKALIEFDFIPDFNSSVDFWYSDRITNIANQTPYIWDVQIPFDMYIEKVTIHNRLNDLTIDGDQYLMAIKRVGELFSNLDLITGSVLSSTLISNSQASQLPSNILGHAAFSSTSTDDPMSIDAEVYDYFNEGAWLVLVSIFEASGTEDMQNVMQISGKSRVKSSKFGVNFLISDYVVETNSI